MLNNKKKASVVFVPWYFMKALDASKLGLDVLESRYSYFDGDMASIAKDDDAFKVALSGISLDDMYDLYLANIMFIKRFGATVSDYSEAYGDKNSLLDKLSKTLVNTEVDKKKEKELLNILMVDDSTEVSPYELKVSNDTVFVILNKGFSDFIIFNDLTREVKFYHDLLNFINLNVSTSAMFESGYFKRFLNLKTN